MPVQLRYETGLTGADYVTREGCQALRRPLAMGAMRRWHVLVESGVAAAARRTRVAGHPLAAQQHLDAAGGQPRLERLRVWNGRSLSPGSGPAMAVSASPTVSKRWWRSRARIHRPTRSAAPP